MRCAGMCEGRLAGRRGVVLDTGGHGFHADAGLLAARSYVVDSVQNSFSSGRDPRKIERATKPRKAFTTAVSCRTEIQRRPSHRGNFGGTKPRALQSASRSVLAATHPPRGRPPERTVFVCRIPRTLCYVLDYRVVPRSCRAPAACAGVFFLHHALVAVSVYRPPVPDWPEATSRTAETY